MSDLVNCKSQRSRLWLPASPDWSEPRLGSTLTHIMAAPRGNTCEALERSIRDRVPPLLTDLYQFTMAYAYWRSGRDRQPAVFELFFRDNPFGGGFSIFAGLHDCLLFLRNFRLTSDGEWAEPNRAKLFLKVCGLVSQVFCFAVRYLFGDRTGSKGKVFILELWHTRIISNLLLAVFSVCIYL